MTAAGTLSILNVGAGDLVISFDSDDPDEVAKARKMVEDMLKAGYALVVEEEDGTHSPVQRFDPETDEYIVADINFRKAKGESRARRQKAPKRRLKASRARATAIAPSAGG